MKRPGVSRGPAAPGNLFEQVSVCPSQEASLVGAHQALQRLCYPSAQACSLSPGRRGAMGAGVLGCQWLATLFGRQGKTTELFAPAQTTMPGAGLSLALGSQTTGWYWGCIEA